MPTASMAGRQTILCPSRYCVIGVDLNRRQAECHPSSLEDGRGAKEEDAVKAFAGSIRVDEGQLYGSTEG